MKRWARGLVQNFDTAKQRKSKVDFKTCATISPFFLLSGEVRAAIIDQEFSQLLQVLHHVSMWPMSMMRRQHSTLADVHHYTRGLENKSTVSSQPSFTCRLGISEAKGGRGARQGSGPRGREAWGHDCLHGM